MKLARIIKGSDAITGCCCGVALRWRTGELREARLDSGEFDNGVPGEGESNYL